MAAEPRKPPAERTTRRTSSAASTAFEIVERMLAMSSFMFGFPGEVVPVLRRDATWVR